MSFCIGKDRLTNGAKILETNDRGALLELDKEGAGGAGHEHPIWYSAEVGNTDVH